MPELPSLRWMLIDVDRLMEGKLAREMAETYKHVFGVVKPPCF
jgi:hypothetical protein